MGTEQKTTSPKTCVSPVSMRSDKAKPAGRIYASLVKHRVTWPEPSELARRDDVMKALWRASAVMVGSPNRNNWGRRSGSTQPYGFDFLIRLDSFAVRNLAGTTLLTMNLFRPFPLHDRGRHQHREDGLQAESCDGCRCRTLENKGVPSGFSNLNSNASVKAHI
jgi:hypothetical protein